MKAMLFPAGLLLSAASPVIAGGTLLTQSCEEAVALSALPERLRGDASVYVLTESGYVKTIDRDGSFTCIVQRNHVQSLIPQCMDSAGSDQIIPALIFKSNLALGGATEEEVQAAFDEAVKAGRFQPPAGAGISYMTSRYNYIYITRAQAILNVGAHVMYYAPNVTNEQIGGSQQDAKHNHGLPFVLEPGIHGYMIAYVDEPSSSEAVRMACQGQVGEEPPSLQ